MLRKGVSVFFLVLFLLPIVQAPLPFIGLPPAPSLLILKDSDWNGEDMNLGVVSATDFNARVAGIDLLFVTRTHAIDVNVIDMNVLEDLNVLGSVGIVGQTFSFDFVNLHANPTNKFHAATKGYVDQAVAGADFDLFLFEIASTDVGGYQQLQQMASEGVKQSDIETVNTDNFLIQAFVTEQSDLNISTLSEGVYSLHVHASAVTAGKQDVRLFWRFFERDPGGTESQIGGNSEESTVLTSAETQYEIHLNVISEEVVDGNRFVVKVFANLDGAGGDPDTTIFYEEATSSRAEFKTVDLSQTSHDLLLNREWVDANHTFTRLGQDINIEMYGLKAFGDVNFNRLFSTFLQVDNIAGRRNRNNIVVDANIDMQAHNIGNVVSIINEGVGASFSIRPAGSSGFTFSSGTPATAFYPAIDNFYDLGVVSGMVLRFKNLWLSEDLNANNGIFKNDMNASHIGISSTSFLSDVSIKGDFIPTEDNDNSVGTETLRWGAVFAVDINAAGDADINGYTKTVDLNTQFVPYIGAKADIDLGTHNLTTTGEVLAGNGVVGNPSYSFASDATTGMYFVPGPSDILAFGVDGVRYMALVGNNTIVFDKPVVSAQNATWADITGTTINATTLDLGIHTITDGAMTGEWDFDTNDLTNIKNVKAEGLELHPSGASDMLLETTSTSGAIVLKRYNEGVAGSVYIGRRARGFEIVPDFLQLNDTILSFNIQVHDGAGGDNWSPNVGQFIYRASEDHNITSLGTKFSVKVTPNGTTGGAANMVIPINVDGDNGTRLGDTTNYCQFSLTGDQTFVGSAGFYPRLVRQNGEPANGGGPPQIDDEEQIIWIDTDDSDRVYLMYNDNTNTNIVKVELT